MILPSALPSLAYTTNSVTLYWSSVLSEVCVLGFDKTVICKETPELDDFKIFRCCLQTYFNYITCMVDTHITIYDMTVTDEITWN